MLAPEPGSAGLQPAESSTEAAGLQQRSAAIAYYNVHLGGGDTVDQLDEAAAVQQRSLRWAARASKLPYATAAGD